MKAMRFFQFRDNSYRTRGFPWAQRVNTLAAKRVCSACLVCGRTYVAHLEGEVFASLEKGTKWPDVMGVGDVGPRLLLSERVIDTFGHEGVTGCRPHPVAIAESKSKKLDLNEAPCYFYIEVIGHVDIDPEASRDRVSRCPDCFAALDRTSCQVRQFVPIEETWDGSDILQMRNCPCGIMLCTERVLLLARKHRWTNFRFECMDVIRRHAAKWRGIDYLGRKWPPQWYPDPPSKGRALEEWLELFRERDDQWSGVHEALLDFGEAAVPPLVHLVYEGTETQRRSAALVLYFLWHDEGTRLPRGVEPILRQEHPDLFEGV
jgi:hypothetical protein